MTAPTTLRLPLTTLALLLLHLDGVGHRDSGEVLGLSESNVATRLGRIRQQLRRDSGA